MKGTMRTVYLFAGEPSGDWHGSLLVDALKEQNPLWMIRGVAGPAMRESGVIGSLRMEDFAVMGITDVIKNLPRLITLFRTVRDEIINMAPDIVVLIDYPAFNIRLAKALRKKGFAGKIVHYICPSVWAHGQGRIAKMADTLDLLLTIFPFEPSYFAGTGLNTLYVGNPVVESVITHRYNENWSSLADLDLALDIVALFPGSRVGEVARNLPVQLEAAERYFKHHRNTTFAISAASIELIDVITKYTESAHIPIKIVPPQYRFELMRDASAAIATSGTVTLELALHKRPTVVHYVLDRMNRLIAQYVMRLNLPYYCIVNILASTELFPELIAKEAPPELIARRLHQLQQPGEMRQKCLDGCDKIRQLLTDAPASVNAARAIESLLEEAVVL